MRGTDGKGELTVSATPSQHFSGRELKDRNATLWSSLVIRSAKHSVFFSGDTGLTGTHPPRPCSRWLRRKACSS